MRVPIGRPRTALRGGLQSRGSLCRRRSPRRFGQDRHPEHREERLCLILIVAGQRQAVSLSLLLDPARVARIHDEPAHARRDEPFVRLLGLCLGNHGGVIRQRPSNIATQPGWASYRLPGQDVSSYEYCVRVSLPPSVTSSRSSRRTSPIPGTHSPGSIAITSPTTSSSRPV